MSHRVWISNLNSVVWVSYGVSYVHADKYIAVYPPVQPYTSTTNHVTSVRWVYGDIILSEKVEMSLNAFVNVQLRIYFLALYLNLLELHSDFFMSYTHESHLGIFSNQRRKKETKNNDWPGWISPEVEKCNGLGCLTLKLSLLMMFLFFYSMFFFFWIWYNPFQHWLVTADSHLGEIQTINQPQQQLHLTSRCPTH